MPKPAADTTVRINITTLLERRQRVVLDRAIRQELTDTRRVAGRLERYAVAFQASLKDAASQDEMTGREIQGLVADYNQAVSLAAEIQKKLDCVASKIARNIG